MLTRITRLGWHWLAVSLGAVLLLQLGLGLSGANSMVVGPIFSAISLLLLGLLWGRLAQRDRRDRMLAKLDERLSAQDGLEGIAEQLEWTARRLLPHGCRCRVYLLDASGRKLSPYPELDHTEDKGKRSAEERDLAARALSERRTLVNDSTHGARRARVRGDNAARGSIMAAPLLFGHRPLGALTLTSPARHALGDSDRRALTLLAERAAPAVWRHSPWGRVCAQGSYADAALTHLPHPTLVLDQEQRIVRYNPALATVLGPQLSGLEGCVPRVQSEDPRLQRLAYILGDYRNDRAAQRRVTIEEPIHAMLDLTVTPVIEAGEVRAYVVMMLDVTELADALDAQTRLLRATAHGLQEPLSTLAQALNGSSASLVRRLERLCQDLLALVEPPESLATGSRTHLPLAEVLEALEADYSHHKDSQLIVHAHPALARQRVPDRWLAHCLATLVEETGSRAPEGQVFLDVEGRSDELVFTVRPSGGEAHAVGPATALDEALGFGATHAGLSLYVSQRLAHAMGGYLWTHQDGRAGKHQLILPLTREHQS